MIAQDIFEVRTRPNRASVFCQAADETVAVGDWVLVNIEDEQECGRVIRASFLKEDVPKGEEIHKILRKATPENLETLRKNQETEKDAFQVAKQKIETMNLPMKLVAVDVLFDLAKIKFFFTADGRVDFRELVRELAHVYKTRIEMRQIGIRDGAKITGGIGICGLTLCCCTWLREFYPITIKMAKEQYLSLNPQKISGNCGRLLCCLGYEVDCYKKAKKDFPKLGHILSTPKGTGPVREINIIKGSVTVQIDQIPHEFTLEDIREFQQTTGKMPPAKPEAMAMEDDSEELLYPVDNGEIPDPAILEELEDKEP